MAYFEKDGTLTTSGMTVFKCANTGIGTITLVRTNNSSAYTITLSRFNSKLNKITEIYTLNLSAGDTLTDTSNYSFAPGDALIMASSVLNTTYLIQGTQL